jgi:outer membrane protein OmpA-like peptidoglycan-associated protein
MRFRLLMLVLIFYSPFQSAWGQTPASDDPMMHSIYFGGGDYTIYPEEEEALAEFLQKIPRMDTYIISIQSHTDDIGSLDYNQWLSRMRSRATYRKLLELGLKADQLIIEDYGETSPVFDNSTWEGKLRNRRVDIVLMKPQV